MGAGFAVKVYRLPAGFQVKSRSLGLWAVEGMLLRAISGVACGIGWHRVESENAMACTNNINLVSAFKGLELGFSGASDDNVTTPPCPFKCSDRKI